VTKPQDAAPKLSPVWQALRWHNSFPNEVSQVKIIPIVLTCWLAVSVSALAQESTAAAAPHEIQVTAKKYEFTPKEIHVKKGEHVKLVVTATDHDHGFRLDEFHVKQKIKKGETVTVEFVADKAGTFPFKCSVVCGFGHRGMKGTLVVEE
jgi:cytochrome c oxidase subunit II